MFSTTQSLRGAAGTADAPAAGSGSGAARMPETTLRLTSIAQRVASFRDGVESEIYERKADDDTRVRLIRDAVGYLDRLVQAEVRTRREAAVALDADIRRAADRVDGALQADIARMEDGLAGELHGIAAALEEARGRLAQAAQHRRDTLASLRQEAAKYVDDLRAGILAGDAARTHAFDRVNDSAREAFEGLRAAAADEAQGHARAVVRAGEDALASARTTEGAVQRRLDAVHTGIRGVREGAEAERAARVRADGAVADALEAVVAKIHGGLALVTKH